MQHLAPSKCLALAAAVAVLVLAEVTNAQHDCAPCKEFDAPDPTCDGNNCPAARAAVMACATASINAGASTNAAIVECAGAGVPETKKCCAGKCTSDQQDMFDCMYDNKETENCGLNQRQKAAMEAVNMPSSLGGENGIVTMYGCVP